MRPKVMAKQLLGLQIWDYGQDYSVLDASNRRIVAEWYGEVKAINPQITQIIYEICGSWSYGKQQFEQ
jgi:hypothetical protein